MSKTIRFMVLGFVLGLSGLHLQAQTSQDNPRLKAALERFPEADGNKDGVLTIEEAKAFRDKRLEQGAAEAAKPASAPKGGERHIYKTVDEVQLPLYVFKPEGQDADAKVPAIVFFFGGGWTSGSPAQFEQHCKYLASRGMVGITVEYRVASRHAVMVEDCIEDAKSAMRWVREHATEFGIDPDRIASGGGSAGGHLAACTAVMEDFDAESDNLEVSPRPNAMVLFNPALAIPVGSANEVAAAENGTSKQRTHGSVEEAFPFTYASMKQPPCVMFFGTKDRLLEGSERYRDVSKEAGNECEIITYEGQGHGFFNYRNEDGKYFDLTVAEMDKFLVGLGWLVPEQASTSST